MTILSYAVGAAILFSIAWALVADRVARNWRATPHRKSTIPGTDVRA